MFEAQAFSRIPRVQKVDTRFTAVAIVTHPLQHLCTGLCRSYLQIRSTVCATQLRAQPEALMLCRVKAAIRHNA